MSFCLSRDAGLWGIARKLGEKEISPRDSDEEIGAKTHYCDPASVSSEAALQLAYRKAGEKTRRRIFFL